MSVYDICFVFCRACLHESTDWPLFVLAFAFNDQHANTVRSIRTDTGSVLFGQPTSYGRVKTSVTRYRYDEIV